MGAFKTSNGIAQVDNSEVGMLIGTNCVKVMEPMETISSRNRGLYAYRTNVGWYILGPITTSRSDGSVNCHRVARRNVASEEIAPHHFVRYDKLKIEDAGIKEILEQIYYSDFCEGNYLQVISIFGNIEGITRKDRRFLDILEHNRKMGKMKMGTL